MDLERPVSTKHRIEWLDILKGICMIAVVFSHTDPPEKFIQFYTPFFLTAFFFASGYTFSIKNSFGQFLTSKIKGLLVPLVTLSLINGVVGIFKGIPYYKRLLGLLIERAGGYESLWFFACLFTCEILFYFLVRYLVNIRNVIMCSHVIGGGAFIYIKFIGVALPWQFELACIALIFVSWGWMYRYYENQFSKLDRPFVILAIAFIYCIMCFGYNNNVNFHDERFGIVILFVVEALLGIFVLVWICKRIKHCGVLSYIGTHSIIIFSFNGQLNNVVKAILIKIGIENQTLLCLSTACISLPVLCMAAFVIYRYFPFIIGKGSRPLFMKQSKQSI